jgi:hypothetical protein
MNLNLSNYFIDVLRGETECAEKRVPFFLFFTKKGPLSTKLKISCSATLKAAVCNLFVRNCHFPIFLKK